VGVRRVGIHAGGIPQQHVLTDQGRRMILLEYDGTTEVIDRLTARLQVPRHVVKRWGAQLGLARRKEPNWTDADEEYVRTHLYKESLRTMATHLGRTQTAVKLKAKRLRVNKTSEGYTQQSLCQGLGCDHKKVARWVRDGLLKGARRGSERVPTERAPINGDIWLFEEKDIRDFLLAYPLEIDQRRMDWLWVVGILSNGIVSTRNLQKNLEEKEPAREDAMQIDTHNTFHMDSDALSGKSIALLGITGSGKTNTAFVLIDELLTAQTAMTIVDIEGEYWQLRERHPSLHIVGRSEYCTNEITRGNAVALAKTSLEDGIPTLLDLSDYSTLEAHGILVKYFGTLWTLSAKVKCPYRIVLEEAHEYLPVNGADDLKDVLSRIALRGRKRGLDLMIISQRSAKLAKDVLTQSSLLFLHKVVHPTDMEVYKSLIPLVGTKVIALVSDLHKGQCVIVHESIPQVVQVRPYADVPLHVDVKTVMRKRIKELEEQVAEQEAMLADQANTIARLTQMIPERVCV